MEPEGIYLGASHSSSARGDEAAGATSADAAAKAALKYEKMGEMLYSTYTKLEEQHQKLQELEDANRKLKDANVQLDNQRQAQQQKLQDAKDQLTTQQQQSKSQDREYRLAQQELQRLHQELYIANHQLEDQQDELQNLRREVAQLRQREHSNDGEAAAAVGVDGSDNHDSSESGNHDNDDNVVDADAQNILLAQDLPEDAEEEEDARVDRIIQVMEERGEFHVSPSAHNFAGRLTIPQATMLMTALNKKSTTTVVHWFSFGLEAIPLIMLQPFFDYIRSSTTLRRVEATYDNELQDNEETQLRYIAHMDDVFGAVQDNHHIQEFFVGDTLPSSPQVMYNLLSKTKSLREFQIYGCAGAFLRLSMEVAREFGDGMSKNSSIKKIDLTTKINEALRIALSGLGTSKVETLGLELYWDDDDEEDLDLNKLYNVVSNLLRTTPSLRHFTFSGPNNFNERPHRLFNILFDLAHPDCNGLQSLSLYDTKLVSHSTFSTGDMTNSTLRKLELWSICFSTPSDVRLLRSLIGLHELDISCCTYAEEQSADQSPHEYWAEFFRRNKELESVRLVLDRGYSQTLNSGILEGVRSHNSLQKLVLEGFYQFRQLDAAVRAGLCKVVQDLTSLKNLHITSIRLESACTKPLSKALRTNGTIRVLCFKYCKMANVSCLRRLLESVLQNRTLHNVSFIDSGQPNAQVVDVAQTLAQGFLGNSTLCELTLSGIDLRGTLLPDILVLGLKKNKSLKKLIFASGLIDNEGLTSLGRALESTDIALEEIGLPACHMFHVNYKDLVEGTKVFLQSMTRAPTLRAVRFGYIRTDLHEEMRQLLLATVKVNKIICNVTFGHVDSNTPVAMTVDMTEIEYYLKLNRFGRRLLNSPNLLVSLWPTILSRMTKNEDDVDALYYFVREYFSRQNTKQEDEASQMQQPPRKHIRLV